MFVGHRGISNQLQQAWDPFRCAALDKTELKAPSRDSWEAATWATRLQGEAHDALVWSSIIKRNAPYWRRLCPSGKYVRHW